jgi:hemerythrin-like domain-containing protein
MLMEHEAERDLLSGMYEQAADLESASTEQRAGYRRRGQEYLAIRAEHIWKENDVLYAMGRRSFTDADNEFLVGAFDTISTSAYGQNAE